MLILRIRIYPRPHRPRRKYRQGVRKAIAAGRYPGRASRQLEYVVHHVRPIHLLHRSRSLQRQPSQSETGNSSIASTGTNERDNAFPSLGNNTPRRTYRRIAGNLSRFADRDWNSGARRLAGISLGSALPRAIAQEDTRTSRIERKLLPNPFGLGYILT